MPQASPSKLDTAHMQGKFLTPSFRIGNPYQSVKTDAWQKILGIKLTSFKRYATSPVHVAYHEPAFRLSGYQA